MSNIDPTEEQRAAVWRMWMRATETSDAETVRDIARLLAEREAKLTASIMKMWVAERTQLNERSDTLRARVAELEASVTTFHEAWKGAERDFNEQTKRVAELEAFQSEWQQKDGNTPGYNLQKAKNYGAQAYEWKQKAIKLEARNAQHLDDIKALMAALSDLVLVSAPGLQTMLDLSRDDASELLQLFAHYDDAKADAPASTEGEVRDE